MRALIAEWRGGVAVVVVTCVRVRAGVRASEDDVRELIARATGGTEREKDEAARSFGLLAANNDRTQDLIREKGAGERWH